MRIHKTCIKWFVNYALTATITFLIGYYYGMSHYSKINTCKTRVVVRTVTTRKDIYENSTYDPKLNASIASDPKVFSSEVTILLYGADDAHIKSILDLYSDVKILLVSTKGRKQAVITSNIQQVGEFGNQALALNSLMKEVKTRYFLYLDESHRLAAVASDHSAGWLLHALKHVALLDVIGGSVLLKKGYEKKYDKLEVPCYRLHHYNWTYRESYEYSQSLGDVMICQRTSTSFLARTSALVNKISFDEKVGGMLFEDFFLRGKKQGLRVGTKPEVMFTVGDNDVSSSPPQHTTTVATAGTIEFGLKHQVTRIRTSSNELVEICQSFLTGGRLLPKEDTLCDYGKSIRYWNINHWSQSGTYAPTNMVAGLQNSLKTIGRFFDEHNYPWWVDAGCALGGLKLRAVLPWDSGDVDVGVLKSKKELLQLLRTKFLPRFPSFWLEDNPGNLAIIAPRRGMGMVTIFTHPGRELQFIRINIDGYYVPVSSGVFREFRGYYGVGYLRHAMHRGGTTKCVEDSNACLPDFTNIYHGGGGTFKEFFVET